MKYKLILEGPDGAGKSTLAKSIGKTWHHGYYEDAKEMFCEVAKSILSECQVIDRCHYSEIVYSGIHRNEKQRLGSKVRMLDRLILSKKYIVVKCLPDYEICYKAWSSGREEMVKDEVKFKKIYQLDKPKGVRGRSSNNNLIRKLLNWEPKVKLEEGLKKTIPYFEDSLKKGFKIETWSPI
mgnify:CR=1 FL=1